MLISVLLSVYEEPIDWITLSINSILQQSYENFELIIVLDNPDYHEARDFIFSLNDSRIVFIQNHENLGLARSLNKALKLSKGQFIARMDADDISELDRFEKQLAFLNDRKDVDIVGTSITLIDEQGFSLGVRKAPQLFEGENLNNRLLGRTLAYHPTWMVRSHCYKTLNGYRNFKYAQDFDFLLRAVSLGFKVDNLDESLLKYRIKQLLKGEANALSTFKSKCFALELAKSSISFSDIDYLNYIESTQKERDAFLIAEQRFIKARSELGKKRYMLALFHVSNAYCASSHWRKKFHQILLSKMITKR